MTAVRRGNQVDIRSYSFRVIQQEVSCHTSICNSLPFRGWGRVWSITF